MATLPPTQDASAEVGSTAKTRPFSSAISDTRRVTTPAPARTVATGVDTPGKDPISTGPRVSSFSVLMTAERQVSGIAPPVYPVPPPRGTIVRPSSIHARTIAAISSSVSGASTTNGYSTRQSVASVTCATRDIPSNLMLSRAVRLPSTFSTCLRNWPIRSNSAAKSRTASCARVNRLATFSSRPTSSSARR